jgi:predicted nucleic-acid-binding protein
MAQGEKLMVTLDTNIWVRYLTNDEELQARRAMKLLEQSNAVFLPKTVLPDLVNVWKTHKHHNMLI